MCTLSTSEDSIDLHPKRDKENNFEDTQPEILGESDIFFGIAACT